MDTKLHTFHSLQELLVSAKDSNDVKVEAINSFNFEKLIYFNKFNYYIKKSVNEFLILFY